MMRPTVKSTALAIGLPILLLIAALAWWLWTPDRSRSALEAKYLRAPQDLLDVAGMRLHVRDEGPRTAPALILLHGLGASLHTWDPWAGALQDRWRVIRLDLPGHGLSDPDPRGDYTDARSRELIVALMDRLGLAQATLVGHSIGGRIAWGFAAREPQRVERLVLVAPDGFASPGFEYGQPPEVPMSLGAMRWVLPRPLLRMSLAPAYAEPASLTDDLMTRYHDLMLAPGAREAMLQRMRQTVLEDPVPHLRGIAAPTLLIWGDQDAMIPSANAGDYLRTMPRATLHTLPGVGHLPHEEDPLRSVQALRAFLERIP